MTNNLKEDGKSLKQKLYDMFDTYAEMDEYGGSELIWTGAYWIENGVELIDELVALINQKEKEAEVRALFKLSKYYDRLEQSHTKDFEGNEIATWSGYKHFRNPITDRIEELIGVRDDKSIYEWLDRIKQLKEELNKEAL